MAIAKAKPKPRRNKQKEVCAESFIRIAEAIRKAEDRPFHPLAKIFDAEAQLLRSMR